MNRIVKIFDETNSIVADIKFDDEKEFLEVWGLEYEKKPIIIVEKKVNQYSKPPLET